MSTPLPSAVALWTSSVPALWDASFQTERHPVLLTSAVQVYLQNKTMKQTPLPHTGAFDMLIVFAGLMQHGLQLTQQTMPMDNDALDLRISEVAGYYGTWFTSLPPVPAPVKSLKILYHTAHLLLYTPLRSLLATVGETWVLGTKIKSQAEYAVQQQTITAWNADLKATRAVWHAVQVIILLLMPEPHYQPEGIGLHDEWCLYISSLVCWAYGIRIDPSNMAEQEKEGLTISPSGVERVDLAWASKESKKYLEAMNTTSWEGIAGVDIATKRRTKGLLEDVRMWLIRTTASSGLLDEGAETLRKLVMGKSVFA
jgi:hypothetical protein